MILKLCIFAVLSLIFSVLYVELVLLPDMVNRVAIRVRNAKRKKNRLK